MAEPSPQLRELCDDPEWAAETIADLREEAEAQRLRGDDLYKLCSERFEEINRLTSKLEEAELDAKLIGEMAAGLQARLGKAESKLSALQMMMRRLIRSIRRRDEGSMLAKDAVDLLERLGLQPKGDVCTPGIHAFNSEDAELCQCGQRRADGSVVERPEPLCGIKGCDLPRNHDGWCNLGPLSE